MTEENILNFILLVEIFAASAAIHFLEAWLWVPTVIVLFLSMCSILMRFSKIDKDKKDKP